MLLFGCLLVLSLLAVGSEAGVRNRRQKGVGKRQRQERRQVGKNQGKGNKRQHGKKQRRGRQEEEEADAENAVDAEGSAEGSGSDIANGCDHLTEIGAFMNHAKELAWCLENDPELELGLYAPLVALAEARAAEGSGSGDGEDAEEAAAAEEVMEAIA